MLQFEPIMRFMPYQRYDANLRMIFSEKYSISPVPHSYTQSVLQYGIIKKWTPSDKLNVLHENGKAPGASGQLYFSAT